jgi:methionine sulfoxide reductase heme-binding subunit
VPDESPVPPPPELSQSDGSGRRRTRRRIRHNLVTALFALILGLVIGVLFPSKELRAHLSVSTAYVSLGCVALSLMLGPLNLLRQRPNPVSSDLRRDLGIWGAIVGLVHVGIGLTVHFQGRMQLYFIPAPGSGAPLPFRTDAFGGANYLGVLGGIVFLILLALSNDTALRWLGSRRWKRWQQLNYVLAIATLLHGVLYQLLEKRRIGFVVLFTLVTVGTLVVQLLGVREWRRPKVANATRRVWQEHESRRP